MSNLVDEVPEAKAFLDEVIRNIEDYKLFDNEHFANLCCGVMATTQVDSQGDQMTLRGIRLMAEHCSNDVIWNLAGHDPLIQPIGRTVAARLFFAQKSGVYFLAGVCGVYDPKLLPTFKDIGIDTEHFPKFSAHELSHDPSVLQAQIAFNRADIDGAAIQRLLEESPSLVSKHPKHSLRKAADPLSVLTILASIWLLTANPFSKAFLERFGTKTADEVIEFLSWVKKKVLSTAQHHAFERVMFEFTEPYKGCLVQFVIASRNLEILCKAADSVNEAARSALTLIDHIEHLEPQKLIYEFDTKAERWIPLHAATKLAGVISDRPTLIALDRYKGFSVGGWITSEE